MTYGDGIRLAEWRSRTPDGRAAYLEIRAHGDDVRVSVRDLATVSVTRPAGLIRYAPVDVPADVPALELEHHYPTDVANASEWLILYGRAILETHRSSRPAPTDLLR